MPTAATRIGSFLLTSLLITTIGLTGCRSEVKNSTASMSAPNETRQEDRVLEALEQEYAIGPRAARSLGYRIGWQSPTAGTNVVAIDPQGDSIFLQSSDNVLRRLTANTGTRLWSASVGSPGARILGVNYLPEQGRVYVIRDSTIMTLNSSNGVLTSDNAYSPIQDLQWIANTAAVVYGKNMIYGSRAGEIVWQAFRIGFPFRAYKIGKHIQLKPQLTGDTIIAIAATGEIVAIDAKTVHLRWSHKLLDRVVAEPTIGPTAVYVACKDQYLRAFHLFQGRLLWRALTESPLTSSPTSIGRFVYQQVPGTGLTCYEALPVNRFDGRRVWVSSEVTGSVLTQRGGNLITWDEDTKQMCLVSISTGMVESTLSLDTVQYLITDNSVEGRIYTLDNRGRLDCLIPSTN
ncbi:MAG: PQQ-binding-like beta-propeller repeat protein [Planctomycetota bacterium]|nr:PQQ-binding-like beta-propeller repeat protein [Planctomycetota bacterium]